jgi:hypothetical protein
MFNAASFKVAGFSCRYKLRGEIRATNPSFRKPPAVEVSEIQSRKAPLWMQRRRNSIHIAIRLWERCVFLRAASLASDECENVQNRSNTANVPRGTDESLFHIGMLVRQGFNTFAHTPQPVNFSQKILENPSRCRPIDR